jgi:hypothetical protein
MLRLTLPVLMTLLLTTASFAQPATSTTQQSRSAVNQRANDPYKLVRNWQRHYLDRKPDPSTVASWGYLLRRGDSTDRVLASFLATNEYYRHSGASTKEFVQTLVYDLTGRKPAGNELAAWTQWASGRDRATVASALIQRYPQAVQPAQLPYIVAARQREAAAAVVAARSAESTTAATLTSATASPEPRVAQVARD